MKKIYKTLSTSALCIFCIIAMVTTYAQPPMTVRAFVPAGATANNTYVAIGETFFEQINNGSYEVAYGAQHLSPLSLLPLVPELLQKWPPHFTISLVSPHLTPLPGESSRNIVFPRSETTRAPFGLSAGLAALSWPALLLLLPLHKPSPLGSHYHHSNVKYYLYKRHKKTLCRTVDI